ncbi:BamA/TamA family outer membrane protein [Myroides odoratimimus]|uniref:translocation and assembly module lipoprotein TamL n=1 Tax=Myroides odoratimimus TaxID=76832 RepID=UPI001038FC3E|nr:BamA/TamA family outer membrane protein [Myroides odoratimimus]MCA4793563.1 BamA/TamA family outer membrane protein [Myroides odoratimimus]MCA4807783.1 BamA/TamA family outer membrane protein [Myroides odoratimimus]MCA4820901.1 BamA/TamA family outer membrane protein [Myroides odoratimimus]MDM1059342.1 BamA/TamA family outer membrane protein [Myroides odoratimimus]MDM1066024.1 BamA/TamA family outer membrane protein [Myroides odoratimimus]
MSISFFACSITEQVPNDRALLMDNTILENGKKISKEEVMAQLYQHPNSTFPMTNMRLRLYLYNLAKPNADSLYQIWLKENPGKEKVMESVLSKKQVDRLGESFIISGINNFLLKTGEAPALYDSLRTNKSKIRLKNYYFNKGFFDTKITTQLDTTGVKKVKNTYSITTGEPYVIDSINANISTKALEDLYIKSLSKSKIKSNTVFDVKNFEEERKRLATDFRDNGAYHFQELNIRYEVDTIINKKNRANIELIIDPRTVKSGDSLKEVPFKIYTISDVNIFTDNSSKNKEYVLDSVHYNNFNIYSSTKLQYKPKALTDAIFITKGSTFSDFRRVLTSRSISNLRTFNYPVIEYVEDKRDTTGQSLISNIYLTSRKKMTFNPSFDVTHSNIQDFGIGGSMGLLFRNVFRGAEILEINLKGSLGSSRQMSNPNDVFFNVTEYGGDVKLTFPRLLFPINTDRLIPKSMLPTTSMSFGHTKQKNIGLDKNSLTAIVNYTWLPSRRNSFSVDLANIQYIRNTNPSNYFSVYKSSYTRLNDLSKNYTTINPDYYDQNGNLTIAEGGSNLFIKDALDTNNPLGISAQDHQEIRSIEERRIRLSENNLIIASNITFTNTTRTNLLDNSFYTLKAKVESAGGLMNLLMQNTSSKIGPTGKKTIMDVEFSQYVKTEVDFVKYFDLGKKRVVAMRAFAGLAVPYGNSNSIPFTRSYYSGGSNDNRGWQSYRLGPGQSGGINDFNEANMKLFFSTEYRFNIGGKWYGALFVDASNIWNVFDDIKDNTYTFNGISSLKDMAVASGLGLRYDFSFFVFRLDMGFKTYNPAQDKGQKWFKEFSLKESVLNVGINYPF